MKKLYEVIFVSEWNNFDLLGWYENLDDAIEDINGELITYGDGKYQLKKGDLRVYPGSFGENFDMQLAQFFEEEFGEEAYDDLQSCEVRGFIYELDDIDYEITDRMLVNHTEKFDFKDFSLTLDNLLDMIRKGQNKAILEYFEENKEKAVYELSGDLIKEYEKITKNKTYIDFEKAGIDKNYIKDEEFWNDFLKDYRNAVLCEDIVLADVELIGYRIFQYEFLKYYIKDNQVFIEKWNCYNDNYKKVGLYMATKESDIIC